MVTQVAAGKRHSLVLTTEGRVCSFGSGLYHALGHGTTEDVWEPKLVRVWECLCLVSSCAHSSALLHSITHI